MLTASSATTRRGLSAHGPGYHQTLPLASRELVRVAPQEGRAGLEVHQVQQAEDLRPQLAAANNVVMEQACLQGVLYREAGVERGIGVLMDHLHGAPIFVPLPFGQGPDILALVTNFTRHRPDQTDDRSCPRVVFPHPDSPTTATTELGSTSRLTPLSTGSSLVVVGYRWVTLSTLSRLTSSPPRLRVRVLRSLRGKPRNGRGCH